MADPTYPLHENPEYNEAIRALQDGDPARASTMFNPLFEAMLNNTHFVKLLAEQLERSKANLVDGKVPLGELPPLNYDPEGTAEAITGAHDKSLVAHTDIRQVAASAQAAADEARAIAEGRSRGASFASYQAMVGALNGAAKTAYKMGDNFFIQTVGVPDLWVSSVESTAVPYTWTTEQAFINALYIAGTLQIGFVRVCELETRKVDLSGYVQKTQMVNGKALTADITLTAPDVGARPDTWMPTAKDVGADEAGSSDSVQVNLNNHVNDAGKHVTEAEKILWNKRLTSVRCTKSDGSSFYCGAFYVQESSKTWILTIFVLDSITVNSYSVIDTPFSGTGISSIQITGVRSGFSSYSDANPTIDKRANGFGIWYTNVSGPAILRLRIVLK